MCTWSFLPHIRGVRGRKRLGGSPGGQRDSRRLRAWTRGLQGQGPQQQASWTKAWWQRQEPAWTCSHTESPQVWRRAIGKFTGSDRAAAPEAKYRKRVRQPFQPHPSSPQSHIPHDIPSVCHLRRLQWERFPWCPPGSQLSHQTQ